MGFPSDQYHANCCDNFHSAIASLGLSGSDSRETSQAGREERMATPSPLNLFMNVPLHQGSDGTSSTDSKNIDLTVTSLSFEPCPCKPGDSITLECVMEKGCVAVLSACPNDVLGINGEQGPQDVQFVVS